MFNTHFAQIGHGFGNDRLPLQHYLRFGSNSDLGDYANMMGHANFQHA